MKIKNKKRLKKLSPGERVRQNMAGFLQALGEDPYVKRQAALFSSEQHEIAMQQP